MLTLLPVVGAAVSAQPCAPPPPPWTPTRPCCSSAEACRSAAGLPWCAAAAAAQPIANAQSNPLRCLPPLPKPHFSWPLPARLLTNASDADGLLLDFARITGSVPIDLGTTSAEQVLVAAEACARCPAGRPCTLAINYSPWMHWPSMDHDPDPTLTGAPEQQELQRYRDALSNFTRYLAVANERLDAAITVGAVIIDSETFEADWWFPPTWPAATARKHELIYNLTREFFPDEDRTATYFYAFGGVVRSEPAFNPNPRVPVPDPLAVAPGFRRDNRFTLTERLGRTPFSPSLYTAPQLPTMREICRHTAALAAEHEGAAGRLAPFVALGCGYRTSIAGCAAGSACGAGFDLKWVRATFPSRPPFQIEAD